MTANDGDPFYGLLNPLPTGSMTTCLSQLAPIVESVKQVGSASIGGVVTNEYNLVVNAAKVEQVVPTDEGATWGPVGPFKMWVDSQDRIRRIAIPLNIPAEGSTSEIVDFKDFGLPVHVSVPLPSQVELPPTDGS